ncbi:MAG TPA: TonB-dependent receptor [Balneolaceae bacterium]
MSPFFESNNKKFLKITLIFVLSILSFTVSSSPLFAQESQDTLKVELDAIQVTAIHSTITAADAPLALSTFSRDLQTINHQASLSLSVIGNRLPGLWVNDRQNYALGERLTIRGIGWRAAFGVRGIQVILNNIPLTVADGQTMFNIVDPAFIREAELIRGPAATFWGNSSGGVLYLSTEPNYGSDDFNIRLRTMGGSFGMRKGEAEIWVSSPTHRMSAYTSYLKTNGFRDYSAAKVWRSGLAGSVRLSAKSRLEYNAAAIFMPQAQHPSSLTAEQAAENPTMAIPTYVTAEAGKQSTQTQAGLSYILDTSAGILNITGYGIYRDLNNPLPFAIITIDRWAGGLRGTFDKSWNHFNLQVGAESKFQHDDRIEFENLNGNRGQVQVDQIEQVWNQALFTTGTFSFSRFNILAGLRYDRLLFSVDNPASQQSGERVFQSLSPSIGVSYQPENHTVFLNLSTSFGAPTTTELVNRPGGGNGFNPFLEPEKTVGIELGSRGTVFDQSLSYDFAVYRMWINDLLFPYQLQTNGAVFYRNQGKAIHTGLEGSFSWQINNNWEFSSTGNIIRAEFQKAQTLEGLSLSGKSVPGIPKYRINSRLAWSPQAFLGSISYEYVSSYAVNNLNTAENDSYSVFDAKFSYRIMLSGDVQLQPFINVNNVFNRRYNGSVVVNSSGGRFYEPAPGRNWQIGISLGF